MKKKLERWKLSHMEGQWMELSAHCYGQTYVYAAYSLALHLQMQLESITRKIINYLNRLENKKTTYKKKKKRSSLPYERAELFCCKTKRNRQYV